MFLAAARPPWIPPCATPGTSFPLGRSTCAASPTTKTSGCPGIERSGSTSTRPARSVGAPSELGENPREFDARRPPADDDEGHPEILRRAVSGLLRLLEREEEPTPDL